MMAGVFTSALICTSSASAAGPQLGIPTTPDDYFQRGTQPGGLVAPIVAGAGNCLFCHSGYDIEVEPYRPWSASMMGQSARDPLFMA